MSNRVSTPFPIYNDTDGSPLDAGFIFIGEKDNDPTLFTVPASVATALRLSTKHIKNRKIRKRVEDALNPRS